MGPARRGLRWAGRGGRRRRGGAAAASFARAERAHSVAPRVSSLAAPWGGSAGHQSRLRPQERPAGCSLSVATATPGAAQSSPLGLGDRSSPSCHLSSPPPAPPPLRERSAGQPRPKEEEEEGSRRWLVWPPSSARPAPARTPSPASYFRTRKVRAAPGDSAAAPVPGSRVCSRVARRRVQTPPWLRPPPAPGSPTSISSSRSSESKRPCLASPPRDPSSLSWGPGALGPRRGDRPWLGAGGAQRGGNLCPTVAGAPNPQPISSGPPLLHRRLSEFTISAVVAVILRSVLAREGEYVCVCVFREERRCM